MSLSCATLRIGGRRPVAVLAMLAAMGTLAGCGGDRSAAPTQTAAKVNRDEISVHQVNLVLQRQPQLAAQPDTGPRKVLDQLIEQELAAQAARSAGFDGDPRLVQAQELAKREWLARAYQDQLAERARGPSSDEVDAYYDGHPALFAQRRLYLLQDVAVAVDAARLDRARLAASAKSPAEVLDTLRGAGLSPQSRLVAQAPEDLPMGIVQGLAPLAVNQSFVIPVPGGLRILSIVHAQPAPMEKRIAAPRIEAFLAAERRRQAVAEGMQALRAKATIQYTGPFETAASTAASAP